MEAEYFFRLRPGAKEVSDREGVGLALDGKIRYAKNARQRAILNAMLSGGCTREKLVSAVNGAGPGKISESEASLAIAEFILDFETFLET
jgi:hypothetical protein